MVIKVGQIIKAMHLGDHDKERVHPFLVVNISKNNIYGVQCSSVKNKDNESYFSRNNIPYLELEYSDIKYVTHIRTDYFEKINDIHIKGILCESSPGDYLKVAFELLSAEWQDTRYMNSNEIHSHVKKGIQQYGTPWRI